MRTRSFFFPESTVTAVTSASRESFSLVSGPAHGETGLDADGRGICDE